MVLGWTEKIMAFHDISFKAKIISSVSLSSTFAGLCGATDHMDYD